MCKLNAALTNTQILFTLLRKRLIPPKRRSMTEEWNIEFDSSNVAQKIKKELGSSTEALCSFTKVKNIT